MKRLDIKSKWLFAAKSLLIVGYFLGFIISFFFITFTAESVDKEVLFSFIGSEPSLLQILLMIFIWLIISIAISLVYGHLSYKYYKYDLAVEGFKKEYGIISKKYTTIPYSRIQNVDIYRSLLARILGLSEIRIQTAGDSSGMRKSEGVLPGVSMSNAETIRTELIKRASMNKNQGI